MFFVLFIGLISFRFLLENLGIVDYGIYNVIFGFLGILAFFSNSITDSCQRFFAIAVQSNDYIKLSSYFTYALCLTFIIGIIFILFSEIIGIKFVTNNLTFPSNKMDDIKIIFHILVSGFFIQIITLPFNSLILAYEKMKVFTYISIAEVLLKLAAVLMLFFSTQEKIILYSFLIFLISLFIFIIYFIYCKLVFKKVKIVPVIDISDIKATYNFFSWNLLGSLASVLKNQGTNLLLNVFYGPVLNAARGIGFQLNGVINMFVFNVTQAVKLQIYKYYADSKFNELNDLVIKSSKYQFFIVLLISYPLLFETEFILDLWLSNYPKSAIIFTQLGIILCIVDSLSYSFMAAVLASGKIKYPSIIVSVLIMLNIPFSYYFLKYGYFPQIIVVISILISITAFFVRLGFYSKYFKRSKIKVLKAILVPSISVLLTSSIIPYIILTSQELSVNRFVITTLACILSVCLSTYLVGLNNQEKIILKGIIKSYRMKLFGGLH
jgi:O-antigen/teichoic acid export membrane protein